MRVSCLANSAGGIVVWGIETAKDQTTGNDVASVERAIQNVESFVRRLEEATPLALPHQFTVSGIERS